MILSQTQTEGQKVGDRNVAMLCVIKVSCTLIIEHVLYL